MGALCCSHCSVSNAAHRWHCYGRCAARCTTPPTRADAARTCCVGDECTCCGIRRADPPGEPLEQGCQVRIRYRPGAVHTRHRRMDQRCLSKIARDESADQPYLGNARAGDLRQVALRPIRRHHALRQDVEGVVEVHGSVRRGFSTTFSWPAWYWSWSPAMACSS